MYITWHIVIAQKFSSYYYHMHIYVHYVFFLQKQDFPICMLFCDLLSSPWLGAPSCVIVVCPSVSFPLMVEHSMPPVAVARLMCHGPLLTQHACLPTREDEGGEEEESGSSP